MPRYSRDPERETIARSLVAHYGQAAFDLVQSAKIVGTNDKRLKEQINELGILVKRIGTRKLISVYDLCEIICTGRTVVHDKKG